MAESIPCACCASTGFAKARRASFSPFSRNIGPRSATSAWSRRSPRAGFEAWATTAAGVSSKFEWKDGEASGVAHQSPRVMAVWEPMGALAEGMEFIELETPIE